MNLVYKFLEKKGNKHLELHKNTKNDTNKEHLVVCAFRFALD
jgi:hypothetical protein